MPSTLVYVDMQTKDRVILDPKHWNRTITYWSNINYSNFQPCCHRPRGKDFFSLSNLTEISYGHTVLKGFINNWKYGHFTKDIKHKRFSFPVKIEYVLGSDTSLSFQSSLHFGMKLFLKEAHNAVFMGKTHWTIKFYV